MALDRLADLALARVELHRALDLEPGRVLVGADADEHEPLAVRRRAVVDDLAAGERRQAVKDLSSGGGFKLVSKPDSSARRASAGGRAGRTLVGASAPLSSQWKTAVSVTTPSVWSDSHFQKTTSSFIRCALSFCLVPMLNTWSWRPAARGGGRGRGRRASASCESQRRGLEDGRRKGLYAPESGGDGASDAAGREDGRNRSLSSQRPQARGAHQAHARGRRQRIPTSPSLPRPFPSLRFRLAPPHRRPPHKRRRESRLDAPLSARIFSLGCITALSAVMGRRMTALASLRSTMTTLAWSRMQMKASDSRVSVWKEMEAGWMPRAVSCGLGGREGGRGRRRREGGEEMAAEDGGWERGWRAASGGREPGPASERGWRRQAGKEGGRGSEAVGASASSVGRSSWALGRAASSLEPASEPAQSGVACATGLHRSVERQPASRGGGGHAPGDARRRLREGERFPSHGGKGGGGARGVSHGAAAAARAKSRTD